MPTPVCVHFWLIEPANGPKSHGRCRLCGVERDFLNWIPDVAAGYDIERERMKEIWLPGSRRL